MLSFFNMYFGCVFVLRRYNYMEETQGWVKFPTGGKPREAKA